MKVIFCALLLVFISCNKYETEIYLIPANFHGKVNVIFNQKNGNKKIYENGNRVYKIPADGILITQFVIQEGNMNTVYHFDNDRTPLRIASRNNKLEENETGIYREGTIGVYGNSSDKDSFNYLEFYVTDERRLKNYFSDDSIDNFNKKVKDKVNRMR